MFAVFDPFPVLYLQLLPQLRSCLPQVGLGDIEHPEHLHFGIDVVLRLLLVGELLVIVILDFSFVSLCMQVNVVSITGKDFSPFSTDTLGSSCPSLPGLLSRCTQSNVQKRGILYPSFSQCRSSIRAFIPLYSRPDRLRGHCSTPSVNHGLCQSFWMLSIFSIIISAKRSSALSSLFGPSVFRFL